MHMARRTSPAASIHHPDSWDMLLLRVLRRSLQAGTAEERAHAASCTCCRGCMDLRAPRRARAWKRADSLWVACRLRAAALVLLVLVH